MASAAVVVIAIVVAFVVFFASFIALSLAISREDRARSLHGRAPSLTARSARTLIGWRNYHGE